MDFIQVLHGCLQSVLWKVRLNPLTDAIPVVNLYLTTNDPEKVSFGAKTSPYGPYGLGYRRAAKTFTKWCKTNSYHPYLFVCLIYFKNSIREGRKEFSV